jgi:hypothetical protein
LYSGQRKPSDCMGQDWVAVVAVHRGHWGQWMTCRGKWQWQHSPSLRATLERSSGNLKVFWKIVDLFHSYNTVSVLDMKVHNYAALRNLQGVVIPQVHGYYNVWGLLKLLALEVVGTAMIRR